VLTYCKNNCWYWHWIIHIISNISNDFWIIGYIACMGNSLTHHVQAISIRYSKAWQEGEHTESESCLQQHYKGGEGQVQKQFLMGAIKSLWRLGTVSSIVTTPETPCLTSPGEMCAYTSTCVHNTREINVYNSRPNLIKIITSNAQ